MISVEKNQPGHLICWRKKIMPEDKKLQLTFVDQKMAEPINFNKIRWFALIRANPAFYLSRRFGMESPFQNSIRLICHCQKFFKHNFVKLVMQRAEGFFRNLVLNQIF